MSEQGADPIDLKGVRAVITGAASGIGLAIARLFLERGGSVHIGDVDEGLLACVKQSMNVGVTRCDVGSPAQVDRLFADAEARMGGVSVLINNAGIAGPTALPDSISIDDWDAVLRTNISGMFYCVRRAVPLLRAAGGGTIINMSSAAIRRGGFPQRLPYAVSKSAVIGLTETLAMDLGRDRIRVNTVMPGTIVGSRVDAVIRERAQKSGRSPDQIYDEIMSSTSMGEPQDASDVAETVSFLCSNAARHVSGQTVSVCGNFEGHRSREPARRSGAP